MGVRVCGVFVGALRVGGRRGNRRSRSKRRGNGSVRELPGLIIILQGQLVQRGIKKELIMIRPSTAIPTPLSSNHHRHRSSNDLFSLHSRQIPLLP